MAGSRPIEIPKKESSTTALLEQSFVLSRSPSLLAIDNDYVEHPKPSTHVKSRNNLRLGLPHKFRAMSEYVLCDQATLVKLGIVMPEATYHNFNLYIKKKDRELENPPIYFIKFNDPGSYLSEFEAFNGALFNFMVDGIMPSAHVIYDDTKPDNPPIGICTPFDKSFLPVKKKAVTEEDLKNPEVIESLAEIIFLAFLLEEDDLHGFNFGWSDIHKLRRVDTGKALWNYLRNHPKLTSYFGSWSWRAKEDIFPIDAKEIDCAPNFERASPRYCPAGTGGQNLFSASSTMMTWFTKNAFTSDEIKIYKDPKNLQANKLFNQIKFKLATKFTYLSRDLILECARLFLRTKEGTVELKHIEEFADHIIKRAEKVREALLTSAQFKTFVKQDGITANRGILEDVDKLYEKIKRKSEKTATKAAYAKLFTCASTQPLLSVEAMIEKWDMLKKEALAMTMSTTPKRY